VLDDKTEGDDTCVLEVKLLLYDEARKLGDEASEGGDDGSGVDGETSHGMQPVRGTRLGSGATLRRWWIWNRLT
jgi:hypothetical protein